MIFVISGPSASGKTTLVKHVRDVMPEIDFSISCTTRPRRPEDAGDARDYDFVDNNTFDQRINDGYFAEWEEVHGNRYGTPWNQIKKASDTAGGETDVVLDVDVKGARNIKERFSEAVLFFVVPPSIEVLRERLEKRNTETDTSINKRLVSLKDELSLIHQYDYVIVNSKLGEARKEIETAIEIFRTRKDRIDRIKAAYL
ncbi:guanylate kinase [Candidatus Mycalebacterium sp.]